MCKVTSQPADSHIALSRSICVQGFLNLFASFFPVALAFLRHMPVIGKVFNAPVVSKVMDKLAGVSAKRRPPV